MRNLFTVGTATLLLTLATVTPSLADGGGMADPDGRFAQPAGDEGATSDPNGRGLELPKADGGGMADPDGLSLRPTIRLAIGMKIDPDGRVLQPTIRLAIGPVPDPDGRSLPFGLVTGHGTKDVRSPTPGETFPNMDPDGSALARLDVSGDAAPDFDPDGWFGNPWIDPPDVPSSPPPTIA
ncbi:MAG: hypothetical protein KDD11_09840 [Acidobacteria bacterium]|nr:hypothetical protein [Acidobacteriota bacterium]